MIPKCLIEKNTLRTKNYLIPHLKKKPKPKSLKGDCEDVES